MVTRNLQKLLPFYFKLSCSRTKKWWRKGKNTAFSQIYFLLTILIKLSG